MHALLRREYGAARLLADHPPHFQHRLKQLCFDLACPPDAVPAGTIEVTRWAAEPLPAAVALAPTEAIPVAGFYDYAGADAGVWHVNFADPDLFFAYGTGLLAQDELQCLEHPLCGSVREALLAADETPLTDDGTPTPILVAGVERRCVLDTRALYGNRFAAATADQVRAALTVLAPPTRSNLIAIAAPTGKRGRYARREVEAALVAAYTGFAAAVGESRRRWPGVPVEVRTGFWGCGAFGGNRHLMTLVQLLAARLAAVARLRLHALELDDFHAGAGDLAAILDGGAPGEPLAAVVDRVLARGYSWGERNGT